MTHEEKQIHNGVHVKLQEFDDFVKLVKEMREAQTEKDIIEMMVRFKIEEEEEIDEKLNVEYATAMTSVVFYEDKVDELIKEMEE